MDSGEEWTQWAMFSDVCDNICKALVSVMGLSILRHRCVSFSSIVLNGNSSRSVFVFSGLLGLYALVSCSLCLQSSGSRTSGELKRMKVENAEDCVHPG
jgi:hypothetical protein